MTIITTRLTVTQNGTISTAAPIPAGEHVAAITLCGQQPSALPGKPFTMEDFPIHHGPWDDSVSLRREDLYGDDGR